MSSLSYGKSAYLVFLRCLAQDGHIHRQGSLSITLDGAIDRYRAHAAAAHAHMRLAPHGVVAELRLRLVGRLQQRARARVAPARLLLESDGVSQRRLLELVRAAKRQSSDAFDEVVRNSSTNERFHEATIP